MTPAPIHSSGNARPWQTRPSADRLGSAHHRHGPLLPMQQPRRSLLSRILGRARWAEISSTAMPV